VLPPPPPPPLQVLLIASPRKAEQSTHEGGRREEVETGDDEGRGERTRGEIKKGQSFCARPAASVAWRGRRRRNQKGREEGSQRRGRWQLLLRLRQREQCALASVGVLITCRTITQQAAAAARS
jgi:hypothetical protein